MDETPDDPAEPETPAAAKDRARACGAEIAEILRRHRCRLVPMILDPEPVGRDGSGVIVRASYGIFPE